MTGTSNALPAAAGTSPIQAEISEQALSEAQVFAATFRGRADLHASASTALRLMHNAFVERDALFPRSGCKTLISAPDPQPSPSDNFAAAVAELTSKGANSGLHIEELASLGLFELSRLNHSKASAVAEFARQLLWLECNSELPLLTFSKRYLGFEALRSLAVAVTELLQKPDTYAPALARGEKWAALHWLGSLDADYAGALDSRARLAVAPPIPEFQATRHESRAASTSTLSGALAVAPTSAFITALAAFSGWLLLRQLAHGALRLFLAYRAQAEVTLSENGLEIRENRSLLGRKLREKTTVLAMPQIRQLSREIRYARAGTYAGLAALGLGSVFGMRLFVDGLRVPGFSGPLLLLGLAIVLLGLGLDFALANWLDASNGRCRFVVIAERGNGLCLVGVDPKRVDAILSELSSRLRRST